MRPLARDRQAARIWDAAVFEHRMEDLRRQGYQSRETSCRTFRIWSCRVAKEDMALTESAIRD